MYQAFFFPLSKKKARGARLWIQRGYLVWCFSQWLATLLWTLGDDAFKEAYSLPPKPSLLENLLTPVASKMLFGKVTAISLIVPFLLWNIQLVGERGWATLAWEVAFQFNLQVFWHVEESARAHSRYLFSRYRSFGILDVPLLVLPVFVVPVLTLPDTKCDFVPCLLSFLK